MKSLKGPAKVGVVIFIIISCVAIAYAAVAIINKTWSTNLTKGDILSMKLVQTDVEGEVSPGVTIDVAPVIKNDGTLTGTAVVRVSYPVLSDGSPAYSWETGSGWQFIASGTGYTVYGYDNALNGGASTSALMSGMTMVEMSGEEFTGITNVNVTVDGWLADTETYGDNAASVWTRIQGGN